MRTTLIFGVLLACTAPAAVAQEDPAIEHNCQVDRYFAGVADKITPKLAWNATSPEEHAAWRAQFLPKLEELLGKKPEPVPLQVVWDKTVETEAFTRRKLYIQSEADYWVPAYYFVPKERKGKTPAIICLHGHSGILPYIREGNPREKAKSRDHELDYALYFAEHGYITLAVNQRGWNETSADKPHSCNRVTMDSFLTGTTPVRLRTWDAMRALDFLLTREEVDPERIAAAGLSGGGTTTLFFAALDPRVKLAMVAGYYCTFRDSIYSIHHCICNCVPHIMEWAEMSDVAALIAPRPTLIISGSDDPIFPLEATQRAYAQLVKTYGVLGAKDKLESDFFEGVHQWSNRKSLPFLAAHFGAP